MKERKRIIKKIKFGDTEVDCAYIEARRPATLEQLEAIPEDEKDNYGFCSPFNPRTYMADDTILCEQDVAIKMRDGITIYADIYRPVKEEKVPLIISWSFFGKRPFDNPLRPMVLMGVPTGTVSNMVKFESADPGYWCHQGYAIANVDPRGIGHSEGDHHLFGTQDGQDGYDFIEWAAQQHWCNGKVALFGNSGVAMTQWRIAAEQPPHLACIAVWEGTGDMYRESLMEGGIPGEFPIHIVNNLIGEGYVDDMVTMAKKYPFVNHPYWEDKIPKFSNVRCPAYVTACWNHFHLRGSIEGFRKIRSPKKWLRVHREFEWPDTYSTKNLEDLKNFYDRYMKNIYNGWELTPKVRLEIQDAFDCDYQINRPEREFPLARTQYQKLYIDAANGTMSAEPVSNVSKTSYDAQTGEVTFDYRFDKETEITGYMKLRLWVEAEGHNDMDLFINIQKMSTKGEWLPIYTLDQRHPGAWGKMRASRRKLDEKLSTDFQPVQAHTVDEKLSPGEIVPVDIEIWPTSRIWHKGQIIRVQVSGRYIRDEWFEHLVWQTDNKGKHIIHSGGKYDSYLQIPVIPAKYEDGDYIYR